MSADQLEAGPAEPTMELDAISSVARALLNSRLVAGLLCVTTFFGREPSDIQVVLLALLMALVLALLLRWGTLGSLLCRHPAFVAVDVLLMFVGLGVLGVDSPFFYVVAGSAALVGLCLGFRGAQYFSPVFLCGWYTAVWLKPPSADQDSTLLVYLLVEPVVVQGVLFGGVALRRLLVRILRAERRLRDQSELAASAQERARLAREMHDTVTKSLYGLAMIAESLPAWVKRDPQRAEEHAGELACAARQAVTESRRILDVMRSDDLSSPLPVTTRDLVLAWAARHDRDAAVDVHDVDLSPGARYEVLAVLAEALENVARHTPSDAAVDVSLRSDGAWLELAVRDSGPGFEVPRDGATLQRAGHYGLVGMRERASRIGASLVLSSTPAGTSLTMRVPASARVAAHDALPV